MSSSKLNGGYQLSEYTYSIVASRSVRENITQGLALDLIVQEWGEGTKFQPLHEVENQTNWRIIQNTLDNIEARISWIEGALTDRLWDEDD